MSKTKIYRKKIYLTDDGREIKTGLSLLGILRESKKYIDEECIICDKIIGKDVDYVILNEPSPYYWHVQCLLDESPEFFVVYKTKTVTNGYFKTIKLFVGHLKDHIRRQHTGDIQ